MCSPPAFMSSPSPWQDDEMESSSMDEQCDSRMFNWCEVMQTEVHEGPYPPISQCYDLLIRLTVIMQAGAFMIDTNPPHSFIYNFDQEPCILGETKIWVNFTSIEKQHQSLKDLMFALCFMGVEQKDCGDIAVEILNKVQPAIPLPQLAIDVTVRLTYSELYGRFDGYDDMRLHSYVKKSWDDFRAAATTSCTGSCAVCLEDFGGGVDAKMIARLPCLHYFHAACTAQWVNIRRTCPVCRTQMMPLVCDGNEPFNPNPIWPV
ncbi:putative transcription factor C2H2 family [Rosa chinensis]|uniref:Putative transcription factor C2H2 family n=1 Tax=Rosa chinensis TaxID=74649 RepID=A0A2P6R538_ROSCH|nr:putative transcription factor C2H2 family [Rosa chinensis]